MSFESLPTAVIVIERPFRWVWSARKFAVLIDDSPFGHVKVGETKEFYTEAGTHTVAVKVDFTKTNPVRVELGEHGRCELFCVPTSIWKVLITPSIWFKPSAHIQLTLKQSDTNPWPLPNTDIIDD
jgi:hypothetical protein